MLKFELKKRTLLAAGLSVQLLWAGIDLYFPRQTDLRESWQSLWQAVQ